MIPLPLLKVRTPFFRSVFKLTAWYAQMPSYTLVKHMPEVHLSEGGILSLLCKIDTKKSRGHDDIWDAFLSRYAIWVSEYLYKIYVTSIDTCVIPNDSRSARIVLIHKSGSPLELSNTRQIP